MDSAVLLLMKTIMKTFSTSNQSKTYNNQTISMYLPKDSDIYHKSELNMSNTR